MIFRAVSRFAPGFAITPVVPPITRPKTEAGGLYLVRELASVPWLSNRLVVAVQAPAVDGKANAAVIKELAKAFDLRTSAFTIVHGELARDKRVLIKGELAALTGKFEALCGTLF